MPPVLKRLGSFFAKLDSSGKNDQFHASASIVNYYTLKSNMGGHRDDLEFDFTKPIVSISIGLAAVFLLGGKTKDDSAVIPILVRPGDVMLMGGESRLCYHGMARVIPDWVELPSIVNVRCPDYTLQSWDDVFLETADTDESDRFDVRVLVTPPSELEAVERFLSQHRLNINIRQVLPNGMNRIPSSALQKPMQM
jgi:alkylated DNA repair protein alkB family protein 1